MNGTLGKLMSGFVPRAKVHCGIKKGISRWSLEKEAKKRGWSKEYLNMIITGLNWKTIPATYVLHWNKPLKFKNRSKTAFGDEQHYIGFSTRPSFRITQQHYKGFSGVEVTKQVWRSGLRIKVGAFFPFVNREKELSMLDINKICRYCRINY